MYAIRWSNGFWKIYNINRYEDVVMFDTRKAAEEALARNE